MKSIDPCGNSFCRSYSICPLRHRPTVSPGRPGLIVGKLPTMAEAFTRCAFQVIEGPQLYKIGKLTVSGEINAGIAGPLNELECALPCLAGLIVSFDSGGGGHKPSLLLEKAILKAKQCVPTVAYIKRALSGGVLPALACHDVFCAPGGQFRGFGSLLEYCFDGQHPCLMKSAQTPLKPVKPPRIPTVMLSGDAREINQDFLNRICEENLRTAALYTNCSIDEIVEILDGRVVDSHELADLGLIKGICSEDETYNHLLKLAESWPHKNKS